MRVLPLLVLCALGLVPRLAHAQAAPQAAAATVTPIPPPPTVPSPPLAPSLAPPADLSAVAGKSVTRVAVVLDGNVWDDVEVPQVAGVRPGDVLTPALARRALEEVLATGLFARGQVSAAAEGAGAVLVVRVVPRKLVKHLQVELHGARVDYDDLIHEAGLSEGGEVVASEIDGAAARIDHDMALHGYPEAHTVIHTRSTDDPRLTLVLVDVTPGAPRLLDQREFYVFGAERDQVTPLAKGYGIRPGDRADLPALDTADAGLEQSLHTKGWYRAHVSHDLVWMGEVGHGRRVALRVRIDTGPLRVQRFMGNDHYDAAALESALGLDTETDRSPPTSPTSSASSTPSAGSSTWRSRQSCAAASPTRCRSSSSTSTSTPGSRWVRAGIPVSSSTRSAASPPEGPGHRRRSGPRSTATSTRTCPAPSCWCRPTRPASARPLHRVRRAARGPSRWS